MVGGVGDMGLVLHLLTNVVPFKEVRSMPNFPPAVTGVHRYLRCKPCFGKAWVKILGESNLDLKKMRLGTPPPENPVSWKVRCAFCRYLISTG